MTRLPIPGSDVGQWGDILNDYLSVSHQTDGTLKPLAQSQVANLTTNLAAKAPLVSPTFSGTVTVPTPANPTDATTKGYVDGQVATGATPDASPSTKGKIQLAGDLAGTAASPTVAKLSGVSLAGLTTGLLKNTTGTGVPSIATAADIPDISATYATATALTTEASTARTAESKAVPRWAPTTTYTLGQQVVSPNNDVVSAIAGFTSGASYVPADWAVSSTYVPMQKIDHGGYVPKPFRVPMLAVESVWPTFPLRTAKIVWVENQGATLYAMGADAQFLKSVDSGTSWTERAYLNWSPAILSTFLKTSAGTLLTMGSAYEIRRSVDDGVTWTNVHTASANTLALSTQSWDIDNVTGYIYFGEYTSAATTNVVLWRSTDDGVTWTAWYTFPGTSTSDPLRISHIHAVQWDHIAGRIVVCTGDSLPSVGIWRVNATGDSLEKVVTNDMLAPAAIDSPRCIGIMPFPDYIAWASDSTSNPGLYRMARAQIGQPNPVIEKIYELNSTAWGTCRAADDGTTWIISASQEATSSLDELMHVYAVTDQGATCWEVGALAIPDVANASALMPIGRPSIHSHILWMTGRAFASLMSYKFQLGKGTTPLVLPPKPPTYSTVWTQNSGSAAVPASTSVVFGGSRAPSLASKLYVFDTGVIVQTGLGTAARLDIRIKGGATLRASDSLPSFAQYSHREWSGPIAVYTVTAAADIEFVLRNTDAGGPITATAFVTAAWGN